MWILRLVIIFALVAQASQVVADEWTTPTERRLASPSQKWEAVVTPAKDGKSGARAAIGSKGKPGTPFTMTTAWMPVDVVLFDDGSLLALDSWHFLGSGQVATLYDRDGSVRWTKTLDELLGKHVESAPRSVSSLWWRKTPLEWSLAKDRKSVLVTLFDENQLELALANGVGKLVTLAKLPDDPPRLLNRARALLHATGQEAAALALLDRALALNPDLFEALTLYVDTLQRAKDHIRAVALIDRVSSKWKTKTGTDIANVCVLWATSLTALSRPKDAERVLRRGVAAAPVYTNPAIALATLLAQQGRGKDADLVLDELVDRLLKAPSLDTFALDDIAEHHRRQKAPKKALALYLKGYRRDQVTNQFLYMNLAKLHEELGDDAEAIRVNEQLLAYFEKMGSSFDTYTKSTREEIDRLRAKKGRASARP